MSVFRKPYLTVLVDDDENVTDYLKELLDDQYGDALVIKEFSDPKLAFEFVKENDVAILISDMKMPGMHGDLFLNMCIDLDKGIKTISMTGYPGVTTAISRYRNGDIGYLTKPFRVEEVYAFVDLAIGSLSSWEALVKKLVS